MMRRLMRPLLAAVLTVLTAPAAAPGADIDLQAFTTSIHRDLPDARFELKGGTDGPVAVVREIEFYWQDENTPVQVISTGGARTMDLRGRGFVLEDMNFDGYTDLRVQAFVPAGPNIPYLYWLYDPKTGRFKGSRELEEIASPVFDPHERVIRSVNRNGAAVHVSRTYRWVDGVPRLLRVEETRVHPDEGVREVAVRELENGQWVTTQRRRTSLWSSFPLPASVSVEQQIVDPPVGWLVRPEPVKHRVTRVTVHEGRPEERAVLRHDEEETRGDRRILEWKLQPDGPAERYWISVHYASTEITLSRPLPGGASALRVVLYRNRRIEGFETVERVEVR
jgi:hypothetical protein